MGGFSPTFEQAENGDTIERQRTIQSKTKVKLDLRARYPSHFQTPLHLALRENNVEIIEILLAFGADPAVRDRRGNNAFHMAAVTGDAEVMRAIARSARKRGDINDLGNGGELSIRLPAGNSSFYGTCISNLELKCTNTMISCHDRIDHEFIFILGNPCFFSMEELRLMFLRMQQSRLLVRITNTSGK